MVLEDAICLRYASTNPKQHTIQGRRPQGVYEVGAVFVCLRSMPSSRQLWVCLLCLWLVWNVHSWKLAQLEMSGLYDLLYHSVLSEDHHMATSCFGGVIKRFRKVVQLPHTLPHLPCIWAQTAHFQSIMDVANIPDHMPYISNCADLWWSWRMPSVWDMAVPIQSNIQYRGGGCKGSVKLVQQQLVSDQCHRPDNSKWAEF